MLAIEIEINTGIKIAILHSRKLRDIAAPARGIVSDEVVAVAGEPGHACDGSRLVRAGKLHLHHRADLPFGRQREHRFSRSQIQAVPISVGEELHAAVALPLVRLEAHGQATEGGLNTLGIGQGGCGLRGRVGAGQVSLEQ